MRAIGVGISRCTCTQMSGTRSAAVIAGAPPTGESTHCDPTTYPLHTRSYQSCRRPDPFAVMSTFGSSGSNV